MQQNPIGRLGLLLMCTLVYAVTAIVCPDQQRCEADQTCCKMTSGQFGCCPFPNAICCTDKEHCCPSGHTCDLLHDRCVSESSSAVMPLGRASSPLNPVQENSLSHPKFNKLMMLLGSSVNRTCLDGSRCSNEATCCQSSSGYGCCPYPNAVCCDDLQHCCPHGTSCSPESGVCVKGEYSPSGMMMISESGLQELEFKGVGVGIVCPGGQYTCPEGSTCCKKPSGDFGCCPFPNAVCCSDGSHCCPAGAQCDLVRQKCVFAFETLAMAQKLPAQKTKKAVTLWISQPVKAGIVCPDHTSKCPEGSTCCASAHGYSCCPLQHAVCCQDKIHCCPARTHCNVVKGTCDNPTDNTIEVPWVSKMPALPVSSEVQEGKVCPGGSAQCEDSQTCCKLKSGDWGCCPLPNAVCCRDQEHCCPSGYTCIAQGKCRKNMF